MGKPYSLDLRSRIVAYVDAGHSARAAARRFGVSASTAVRLLADRRAGSGIAPRPQGRAAGTVGKLAPHRDFLIEIVRAEPDITLKELAAALAEDRGVCVQLSSLHRALVRAGYSYKKAMSLNCVGRLLSGEISQYCLPRTKRKADEQTRQNSHHPSVV